MVTGLLEEFHTSHCQVEGQLIHQVFFRLSVLNFMKLVFLTGEESNLWSKDIKSLVTVVAGQHLNLKCVVRGLAVSDTGTVGHTVIYLLSVNHCERRGDTIAGSLLALETQY